MILVQHQTQLKRMFGQIPNHIITQTYTVVSEISDMLSDECHQFIEKINNSKKDKILWGQHIKCNISPYNYDENVFKLEVCIIYI